MRKRHLFIVLCVACAAMVQAASMQPVKLPQVRSLEAKGWTVQHAQLSFDSLTIYFSAKEPNRPSLDLYAMQAEGWRWGQPMRIDALSSELDEEWPSISADEQTLFFVRRTPADPNDKHSYERTQIYRSLRSTATDDATAHWSAAEPIIISGNEDTRPFVEEDNRTLTFWRNVESRKSKGASEHSGKNQEWLQFRSRAMDEHNWMLPVRVNELGDERLAMSDERLMENSNPLTITGTIVHEYGKRPLATGRVYVYDAITQQLRQVARVHSVTGRFRIALQQGETYRLDLTAPEFSHHYENIKVESRKSKVERDLGTIALSEKLSITFLLYDQETQESLGREKQDLKIGATYSIPLVRDAYRDTTITLNTERQVLFSQAELDIPLTPKKSRHTFSVINSVSGEPVPECSILLDGHAATTDTLLRIRRNIAMQVTAPGFLFYDTLFSTGQDERPHTITVRMRPIEKDLVLQLRNIQFAYDSHELTAESDHELNQLLSLMRMNPTLRIELSAHTDDRGNDKYNDRLSTLRGQAVLQWLTDNGIDASRIQAVGYGKRRPLVPNDTEENRAINRRVEIKVIDF